MREQRVAFRQRYQRCWFCCKHALNVPGAQRVLVLPLPLLVCPFLVLSLLLFLIMIFGLTTVDFQDLVIGWTRPLWGYTDKPTFAYEIPYFEFESPAATCVQMGWRARDLEHDGKLFDTFIFSTELDLLEIRLRELDQIVDVWVLVESDRTHTNRPKELWWESKGRFEPRFRPYLDRIESVIVRGSEKEERFQRRTGPFGLEALQRRAIMQGLHARGLKSGDVFITGDVDEIPRRGTASLLKHCDLFPPDLTLHMPTTIGGFQFISYEEDKRHTKARTYWSERRHAQWTSHHRKIGHTLLLNAGWHCSWCFPSLAGFRFKMEAGVHSDRSNPNKKSNKYVSDVTLNERLCRGEPPLEREYERPESYTFADVMRRWRDKLDVEGRRRHRNDSHVLSSLPLALQESPHKFSFLMPGGECQRNVGIGGNLILDGSS